MRKEILVGLTNPLRKESLVGLTDPSKKESDRLTDTKDEREFGRTDSLNEDPEEERAFGGTVDESEVRPTDPHKVPGQHDSTGSHKASADLTGRIRSAKEEMKTTGTTRNEVKQTRTRSI